MAASRVKKPKYRSGLEKSTALLLTQNGLVHKHEATTLKYLSPACQRRYTIDFDVSGLNDSYSTPIHLETKGRFTSADRKKMQIVVEQFPERVIVMVFGRSSNTLSKKSQTTYGEWCDKHGILWVDYRDFQKDPKKCLLSLIKKKGGKSKTPHQKNSSPSKKSARK